jgi:hypothetical protein
VHFKQHKILVAVGRDDYLVAGPMLNRVHQQVGDHLLHPFGVPLPAQIAVRKVLDLETRMSRPDLIDHLANQF